MQIKLKTDHIPRELGLVPVQGEVVSKFRGDDKLCVGNEVSFRVALHPDDSQVIFGWYNTQLGEFKEAKFLEVFLDGIPPKCEVSDCRVLIVGAPSTTPSAHVPTEKELWDQPAEWDNSERARHYTTRPRSTAYGPGGC